MALWPHITAFIVLIFFASLSSRAHQDCDLVQNPDDSDCSTFQEDPGNGPSGNDGGDENPTPPPADTPPPDVPAASPDDLETLPVARIGRAALINPADVVAEYLGGGTAHTQSSALDNIRTGKDWTAEIDALARALQNDPHLIYQHVRNMTHTEWMYGLKKGALGIIIDRSGTPFDQAHLLMELLKAADLDNNASYVLGTIRLDADTFINMTGISTAKGACELLAYGGIPAKINGQTDRNCDTVTGEVSSVEFSHIWIDYAGQIFDPALKSYIRHDWNENFLQTASTSGSVFSAGIGGVQTLSSGLKNFDNNTVDARLNGAAGNVADYFAVDAPELSGMSAIGEPEIVPLLNTDVQNPDLAAGGFRQSIQTWDAIPDSFRTRVSISVRNAPRTFQTDRNQPDGELLYKVILFQDEFYGRRLELRRNFTADDIQVYDDYFNFSFELRLDDQRLVSEDGSLCAITAQCRLGYAQAVSLELKINAPYLANSKAYMDATLRRRFLLSTSVALSVSSGFTSERLLETWAREKPYDDRLHTQRFNSEDCKDVCFGDDDSFSGFVPQFPATAPFGDMTHQRQLATYLAQLSRSAKLVGRAAGGIAHIHHVIGLIYTKTRIVGNRHPAFEPDNLVAQFVCDLRDGPEFAENCAPQGTQLVNFQLDQTQTILDLEPNYSIISGEANTNLHKARRRGGEHALSIIAAMLEGSVIEQLQDLPDAGTTVSRFAWANRPPAMVTDTRGVEIAGDYGARGPRPFLDFTGMTDSEARENILWFEGTPDIPARPPTDDRFWYYIQVDRIQRLAYQYVEHHNEALGLYIDQNFHVTSNTDVFLGPGVRFGASDNILITYLKASDGQVNLILFEPSTARGGALIATRYGPDGEPSEIAHIVTSNTYALNKGGNSIPPSQQSDFDPSKVGELLQDQFVDRSSALGVDLASGRPSIQTPVFRSVGVGEFPYKLEESFSFSPAPPTLDPFRNRRLETLMEYYAPQGWRSNREFSMILGSAGLLAMGNHAAASTASSIVAVKALVDLYGAQTEGNHDIRRDVVGSLIADWWRRQITGGTSVTLNLGSGSALQFVRLADQSWAPPANALSADLQVTGGQRTREYPVCYSSRSTAPTFREQSSASAARWRDVNRAFLFTLEDQSAIRFDSKEWRWYNNLTPTDSDANYPYTPPSQVCDKKTIYPALSWTFPQGISLGIERTIDGRNFWTSNTLRRSLVSPENSADAFVQSESYVPNSEVHRALRLAEFESPDYSPTYPFPVSTEQTFVDDAGQPWTYRMETGSRENGRPSGNLRVVEIVAPDGDSQVTYAYDPVGNIKEARDAVSAEAPNSRDPHRFYISNADYAARKDPEAGLYQVTYDARGRAIRFVDEEGRTVQARYDDYGRVTDRIMPEGDCVYFEYSLYGQVTHRTRLPKDPNLQCDLGSPGKLTASADYNDANWVLKPTRVQDDQGAVTYLEYGSLGTGAAGQIVRVELPCPTDEDCSKGDTRRPVYRYSYTFAGLVDTVTDPEGMVTKTVYDDRGYPACTIVDFGGQNITTGYAYNDRGDQIGVIDPRGMTVEDCADNQRLAVSLSNAGPSAPPSGQDDPSGSGSGSPGSDPGEVFSDPPD